MDHETTYTILIQDEKFTLSHSQISFDSPNYFTTCFLGEFRESQTRSVQILRSPNFFPLIRDYLCGYMADALFYQLEGLVNQCDEYLEPVKRGLSASHRYLLVGWEASTDSEPIDFRNLDMNDLDTYLPSARQRGWHLYVTKKELEKLGMMDMVMREVFIKGGTEGVRALTGVNSVVEKILPSDGRRRWVVGVINRCSNRESEEDGDDEENDDKGEEDEQGGFEGFDGEVTVVMLEE